MSGGDRDLKVEAIRGGVRDLKIDDAAAMGGGDRGLKMKEDAAMEGGDLNLKLHSVAIGQGFHELWIGEGDRDLKEEMKDEGMSEGGDTLKRRKPWEEAGGILKLKKEVSKALDKYFRTQCPARMARKDAQEKAQALVARKKKMKVVRTKFTKEFIDHMAAFTFTAYKDLTDGELAQCPPYMREVYDAIKVYEAKQREYFNALVAQQNELGYAEDEIEVTDDDEEEAVVKN